MTPWASTDSSTRSYAVLVSVNAQLGEGCWEEEVAICSAFFLRNGFHYPILLSELTPGKTVSQKKQEKDK